MLGLLRLISSRFSTLVSVFLFIVCLSCGVLSGSCLSLFFPCDDRWSDILEGVPSIMVWWNLRSPSARSGLILHYDIMEVSLFSVGCFATSTVMSFRLLYWTLVSCFHRSNVIRNYWRDCSALASDVLGSIIPDLLFRLSATERVSMGSLLYSTTGLLW